MGLRKSSTQEWTLGSFFSDFSLLRLVSYLLDKMEILRLNKFCVDRKFHSVVMKKNSTQNLFQKETLVSVDDGSQSASGLKRSLQEYLP